MNIFRYVLVLSMISLSTVSVLAQKKVDVYKVMEDMFSDGEQVENYKELYETLEFLVENPINLNVATREDLQQFPFLSEEQIEEFLYYRYSYGELLGINVLKLIPTWGKREIELLSPFVCVLPIVKHRRFPNIKNLFKYTKRELSSRLCLPLYNRRGNSTSFLGSKLYNNIKYKASYSDLLEYGFSAEKDAGEPMFAYNNKYGYDYYSFFFLLKDYKRVKRLAVGDYRVNFGEGLVVNKSFSLKPSYYMSDYNPKGIRCHSSVDEVNFFRGLASTFTLSRYIEASVFYSFNHLDARLVNDSIRSISHTGLHRTISEQNRKRTAAEHLLGSNITFDANRYSLGLTYVYSRFSYPYSPTLSGYRKYFPRGRQFYNIGVNYRYYNEGLIVHGEFAKGKTGLAIQNTCSYTLPYLWKLKLIHRYFSKDYQSLHSQNTGVNSRVANEHSVYLASEYTPQWEYTLFNSIEFFHFPFSCYRISRSSSGMQTKNRFLYRPTSSSTYELRYSYKKRDRDFSYKKKKYTMPTHNHKISIKADWLIGDFVLRTKGDYNIFSSPDKGNSNGYGLTQMVAYSPEKGRIRFSQQIGYYDADDYDSRIYSYERGVLGSFYIPSYFCKSLRSSSLIYFSFAKRVVFQAKYSITHQFDKPYYGSGVNTIQGKNKQDVEFFLRIRL